MSTYEERLTKFDRAIGVLMLNQVSVGHIYFEITVRTIVDVTPGRLRSEFEAPMLDFDLRFDATPEDLWDGSITTGSTPKELEAATAEVLDELEKSTFLFRAVRYDIRWIADPEERMEMISLFR